VNAIIHDDNFMIDHFTLKQPRINHSGINYGISFYLFKQPILLIIYIKHLMEKNINIL
jgi:hypothetical protein